MMSSCAVQARVENLQKMDRYSKKEFRRLGVEEISIHSYDV